MACKTPPENNGLYKTHFDRSKPNSWVYKQTKSLPLSLTIHQRQIIFYAHCSHHPDTLSHSVCFGPGFLPRTLNSKLRPGRPRHHWQQYTENLLYDMLRETGNPVPNRASLHAHLSGQDGRKAIVELVKGLEARARTHMSLAPHSGETGHG